MARRKKKQEELEEAPRTFEINPETKKGIAVIALFASAALLTLSFLGLAGSLGVWINENLSLLFGPDKVGVVVLLVLIGATTLYPERGRFSVWNYLGFFFFFLSFNALLNLVLVNQASPVTDNVAFAGGYLGQFLGLTLPPVVGYWGSLVTVASLLVAAILLAFNTSLRSLTTLHRHFTGWFGERFHLFGAREKSDNPYSVGEGSAMETRAVEMADVDVEEEEEETDEEEDEQVPSRPSNTSLKPNVRPMFVADRPGVAVEKALTVKKFRKVIVPLDLLNYRPNNAQSGDIERNKEIIRRTLEQFSIPVEMSETATGPTVTQYTLRPAQGVKLARILALQNDLALSLAAHPIRIEAPIPGKSLVGIEVPNETIATVSLRELLESKSFQKRPTNLSVALGKDVSGAAWVVPLDKMPHVLVAGSTGSGKSVCLNTMILSLLYENGPDELKLIMVDPKRVELNAYEGIPHLLVPPIMKVEDTVNALKWTVREMERRLDVLSKFGARDINSYNERAEEKMPKIVVIIDELADLMTSSGREVEGSIVRIAQMARAVGIHLVLATQRPSVDVITGLIKANVPARIAFAVASQMDSRTILDAPGADKLLGRGDMLISTAELSKPKRLQGAYVSDDEIRAVVTFLKSQGAPDYNHAIVETARTGTVLDSADSEDPLLEEAANVIIQAGRASTSLLQRRLKVGYGRAARIMDMLEDKGIIGPGDGAKPREVLVDSWPSADFDEDIPTAQDDLDEAEEKPAQDDGSEAEAFVPHVLNDSEEETEEPHEEDEEETEETEDDTDEQEEKQT